MYKIRATIVYILYAFLVVACASPSGSVGENDYGQWTLNQVVYGDGDSKDFASNSGNFVEISKAEISEIYAEHGKRTYAYTRVGDVLTLLVGSERITWAIADRTPGGLKIDTPIGRYVLSR